MQSIRFNLQELGISDSASNTLSAMPQSLTLRPTCQILDQIDVSSDEQNEVIQYGRLDSLVLYVAQVNCMGHNGSKSVYDAAERAKR